MSENRSNSTAQPKADIVTRHLTADLARAHIERGDDDYKCYTSIDDEAIESLSTYKGTLNLNGLSTLSDAATESMRKCKGDLKLSKKLSILSPSADACLAEHLR